MIKISLIGMSGCGKSYWTRKMSGAGFRAIGIDDSIERKLAPELKDSGYHGIEGVAAWMGWPNQPAYREREQRYLAYEIESMQEALDEIEHNSDSEGIVLDTTGSLIYTGSDICRRLQRLTTVIYLSAGPKEEEILIARYLSDPKPVLWGDQFSQRPGETVETAIGRCYPQLIAHRNLLYEKLAHHTIAIGRLRESDRDARGFLELLSSHARPAL